jgi:hypothetical protein
MYKHEILNDLSCITGEYDIIKELVKSATEIHIGNMYEFINMDMFAKIKRDMTTADVSGNNPFCGLMAPFENTLFTCFLSKLRAAVIVTNNNGLYLEAITLISSKNGGEWNDSGVVRVIITGNEEDGRSILRENRGITDRSAFKYKSLDVFGVYLKKSRPDFLKEIEVLTERVMNSVILALHFLSCKNVKLTTTTPKISAAQRITSKAKNKLLPFEYRTITIDGIGKQKGGTLGIGTTEQRLHICRGHFAEYTEDGKLFGKYVGRYWIPAHMKGNPELGTIEKDYEVKHAEC